MVLQTDYPHVDSGVYVLRLEGGKYYVGSSEDIHRRLSNHSSEWTKRYNPIEVVDTFPAYTGLKDLEREVTLMYMKEHGWENVRGAGWTKVDMKRPPKALRPRTSA